MEEQTPNIYGAVRRAYWAGALAPMSFMFFFVAYLMKNFNYAAIGGILAYITIRLMKEAFSMTTTEYLKKDLKEHMNGESDQKRKVDELYGDGDNDDN